MRWRCLHRLVCVEDIYRKHHDGRPIDTVLILAVLVGVRAVKGIVPPSQVAALAYVLILFLFVAYLCFGFDPERSPTIATFIRSKLGLGVVLMPLFVPFLIVGSVRCRRLLDAESSHQPVEL